MTEKKHDMGVFERYLTLWVGLCIILGILLGQFAPEFAKTLDGIGVCQGSCRLSTSCHFFMVFGI
jgi:arsenite transporter